MSKMKCYYAHCMSIYNTLQEDRDVVTLEELGFEVVNPNCQEIREAFLKYKEEHPESYMQYFLNVVSECDCVAFRSLPTNQIPAGVAKEILHAGEIGLPVFELPSGVLRRILSVDETREYLRECGQR